MPERPERMILPAVGLDQHDDEGPGVVRKPDGADALAGAAVHDGHPRIFFVKRNARIEIARGQRDMGQPEIWHRKSSRFDVYITACARATPIVRQLLPDMIVLRARRDGTG